MSSMRSGLDIFDECLSQLQPLQTGPPVLDLSPGPSTPAAALDLRALGTAPLDLALRQRPVTSQVHEALVRLYERALTRLKLLYLQQFEETMQRWGSARERVLPPLQRVFQTQCAEAAAELQRALLQLLDERLRSYDQDANTSAEHRGHSAHALAILENAFMHAPNITQAEKYKLAEATGLQPRQVTIWTRRSALSEAAMLPDDAKIRLAPRLRSPPPARLPRLPRAPAPPQDDAPKPELGHTPPAHEWPSSLLSDAFTYEASSQTQTKSSTSPPGAAAASSLPTSPALTALVPAAAPTSPMLTLDQLLDEDDAMHTLVFSPLDSLPRLDFQDLGLDVPFLEQWLGLPVAGAAPTHLPPVSARLHNAADRILSPTFDPYRDLAQIAAAEGWLLSQHLTPLAPMAAPQQVPISDLSVRVEGSFAPREHAPRRAAAPAPTTPQAYAAWPHDPAALAPNTWDPSRLLSSTFV